ncbi:hypothetical protein CJF32_00007947 [Rutstroemia sp. NJR-2017a WRK4]|nr:hypothetical protein CJF32_00007947 [Rutstroemia sp. NJR-2017a WRK4]
MEMPTVPSSAAGSDNTMSMSMAMDMSGNSCKLSMLLNWSTIDTCYLTSSFHVHSTFQFVLVVLLCFLLPIALELLRRYQRTYDRYLRVKHRLRRQNDEVLDGSEEKLLGGQSLKSTAWTQSVVLEQALRGLLHMAQFGLSYCIMMMWMYSNGYILIAVLLGALCGFGMLTKDMLDVPIAEM